MRPNSFGATESMKQLICQCTVSCYSQNV